MLLPNLTITFLICHRARFLLIRRSVSEKNFPGLWAFPGGKVEPGETIVDTIHREVFEETALTLEDEFVPLNSYCFPGSVGLACLVRSTSDRVVAEGFDEYEWISSERDMASRHCIPGIYNHLRDALREQSRTAWLSMEAFRLSSDKYVNDG
jgi:8-oxo-dGTP pyrophosphatase MutT (NUDIX family)